MKGQKLRVLVVDDEYLLREHIRNTVDWEALDLEVVGEARDGMQALEQVEALKPDIVLTDVNMPNLNGVELAKRLRQEHPEICVIIITGYGEFEYAKEAINAGVFNYLLKPVEKETYSGVLLEAKEQIAAQREQRVLANAMEHYRHRKGMDYAMTQAFFGQHDQEAVEQALGEYGIVLSPEALVLVVITWDSVTEALPAGLEPDHTVPEVIRAELIKKVFEGMRSCVFERNENELIAIFNMDMEPSDVIKKLEDMFAALETKYGIKAYAGMSGQCDGYESVPTLYMQAKTAQKQHFVLANYKVIVYSDQGRGVTYSISRYFDADKLLIDLRLHNIQAVLAHVEGAFQKMQQDRVSEDTSHFTVLMLLSILNEFLMESNRSIGYDTNELIDEVSRKRSVEELWAFTNMLFEKTMDDVLIGVSAKKSEKVAEALSYIQEHYTDSVLSLNTVANALYLNASYLSSIFKKEVGVSMVEFINQTRLNRAKALLDEDGSSSIAEIAMQVGYSNEYYFTRCFKKQFGVPPKTYVKTKK